MLRRTRCTPEQESCGAHFLQRGLCLVTRHVFGPLHSAWPGISSLWSGPGLRGGQKLRAEGKVRDRPSWEWFAQRAIWVPGHEKLPWGFHRQDRCGRRCRNCRGEGRRGPGRATDIQAQGTTRPEDGGMAFVVRAREKAERNGDRLAGVALILDCRVTDFGRFWK